MKKIIKTTNFTLTDDVSKYLEKRMSVIDRYVEPDDTSAILEIEIGKTTRHHQSGDIFRAEANMHARHIDLRAEAERDTILVAIDAMKDELVNTLRSKKHKRITLIRRGGLKIKNFIKGFGRSGNKDLGI